MNPENLASNMISAASAAAGSAWQSIQQVAVHEFQVLASRITSIGTALGSGQMKPATATILFRTARSQIISVLALLSTMVAAAAQKVVKAALNVVKSTVNAAVGFALIV